MPEAYRARRMRPSRTSHPYINVIGPCPSCIPRSTRYGCARRRNAAGQPHGQQSSPRIFSPTRRLALRNRALRLQQAPDAPRFLIEDMIEDVLDRLAFLRLEPKRALVIGDFTGDLARQLRARGAEVIEAEPSQGFDEEQPYPFEGFDLIASLGTLDTLNDLPGALVHMRRALAPGGLMMASFLSAGSVPVLREAMLAADGERPAARLHPTVDVRSGGQLLQRTLYADPVIDHRAVHVSYRSLPRLVQDLRALGATSVLADRGPVLGKAAYARAAEVFAAAGEDGRTTEIFEILTLSGWKPKIPEF
ncbi:methyltransferase domain-containing protein [Novosphingobium sp. 9]|uniref:methyltransferase domain-containing protein n=1 Tax=Novosphingobium sp. 9 TaxID=2025349 RepID=UPI0028CBB826|nr:methyltransferase domain-containing protein [Novosphingobium sp. 9]